jgi:hypothetical protein
MSAFEFEGHETLIAALRAGTLDAPDHLHRRVLAGAPARRRRIAAMSARQRFFIALPAAASIAVVAAVVNGVFFTSSSHPTPFNAARVVAHGQSQRGPFGPPGQTGALGATGAKGATGAQGPTGAQGQIVHGLAPLHKMHRVIGANGATGAVGAAGQTGPTAAAGPEGPVAHLGPVAAGAQDKASALTADAFSAENTPAYTPGALIIPKGRLIHADANLQVVVPDCGSLTTATNKATAIVTQLGGYAQSVQYRAAAQKCAGSAYLDLRVPLGKTEVAITRLGGLGELVSQSVSTQDLQKQYTKQTSQIGQLQREIAVYEQELQSGTLSGSQRIEVEAQLTNAKHALTGTRKARIRTVKAGTTSDIQLLLTTKRNAAAYTGPHKTGRLGQMLHNMVVFLGIEGIIFLYVLLVALPIILVGGLIWWLTLGRRRRDEKELLASA